VPTTLKLYSREQNLKAAVVRIYIYIDADLLAGWLAMHVLPIIGSCSVIRAYRSLPLANRYFSVHHSESCVGRAT
jgi:hypothetical protein